MCRFIDSGFLPPATIMAKDRALLNELEKGDESPTIHFYEWEGQCLTYGYFIKPEDHLNLEAAERLDLRMARRPTGGGIIFHLTDLAFSVLIPTSHSSYSLNTLDNYAYINHKVAKAIALFLGKGSPELLLNEPLCENEGCIPFCMAKPTRFDVILEGKKVGGAAQRRTKWGYLHQGTISLAMPPKNILDAVLKKEIVEAMEANTFSLLAGQSTPFQLKECRQQLKQHLKKMMVE
jgi:lipoate---protein ligase